MSFSEAVEYLAKRASISLPVDEFRSPKDAQDKNIYYKLNLHAGSFYKKKFQSLNSSHEAKKYLTQRGLSQEMIETFKIGYAPAECLN